jgi:hypothetical protein
MKTTCVGLGVLIGCVILAGTMRAQEVTPTGTSVANFDIGNRRFGIFPVLANATSPVEQWQFRYEPLLLPEMDALGQLAIVAGQNGAKWTTAITVHIGDAEPNRLAYQSLIKAYPNTGGKIIDSNVSHLRLEKIAFRMEPPIPQQFGQLVSSSISPGAAPTVAIVFSSPTQEAAKNLEAMLRGPDHTLICEYEYRTRATKAGTISIKMKDLQGTKLYVALDGIPNKHLKEIVYVRRNDLRTLTKEIFRETKITEVFEDPALVNEDIIKTLLDRWNQTVTIDLSKISQETLKSTYNAQDINPDRIERQVNEWFRKTQNERQYQANKRVLMEGGFDVAKIFGGSAKNDITLSESEVRKALEDIGYKVDFTGLKIIPKSIDLKQVNMTDFNSEFQVTQSKIYVGNEIVKGATVGVQLGQAVAGKAALLNLAGRVALLEKSNGTQSVEIKGLDDRIRDLDRRLGGLAAQNLQHTMLPVGIRTGPENGVGPAQKWRIRVTTTQQPYKVGNVSGSIVALWVDWPHHTHEQVRYTHVVPEANGKDVVLIMRAVNDTDVSISTIHVHALHRSP